MHKVKVEALRALFDLARIFLDWDQWYLVAAGLFLIGPGIWLAARCSQVFRDSRGVSSAKRRWALLFLGWGGLIALAVVGLLVMPWRSP